MLPPRFTPTDIRVKDNPIVNLSYILQVRLDSPITDQFLVDPRRDFEIFGTNNGKPTIVETTVQLLQDNKKSTTISPTKLTLSKCHHSSLTTVEEHRSFFYEGHTITEPIIHHYKVFSTTIPVKYISLSNLSKSQAASTVSKEPMQIFGLLTAPFPPYSTPSTNQVLYSVLDP